MSNTLYYGDNLDILCRYISDESVDLVYLDPPFNSNRSYNVLFREQSGERAEAQIRAFEDTWEWNLEAARSYESVVEAGGKASEALQAFHQILKDTDMMAYLAMMAPRLIELQRVLKSTGSIYLHCDPNASHYLKILMDSVFGPEQFLNEIVWKRHGAHNSANRYGSLHDTLLFYSKSDDYTWNAQFERDEEYFAARYTFKEPDGRMFYPITLHAFGVTRDGDSGKPWRGIDISAKGGHWKYGVNKLDELDAAGRIYWPNKEGGMPRLKVYADEAKGRALQDVWLSIPPLNSQAQERLGYPTQKPEALLDRIILSSSNVGDVVLDPFCGCGTTIAAAQRLGRRWTGIDITHLAIGLIKYRLQDQFGEAISRAYTVVGEPTTVADAQVLAAEDPFQFQAWSLGLVGARTAHSAKKGSDKGIDGNLYFHDDPRGSTKRIVLSVKAGQNVGVSMVRDLVGTVTREKAEIGVLITMAEPTSPMMKEAASAGFYTSPMGGKHAKVQVLTIADLLDGKGIDYPSRSQRADLTFKKARRIATEVQALPLSAFVPSAEDAEL